MKFISAEFTGVKARLQRISDCSLFEGWVTRADEFHVTVQLRSDRAFSIQDEFYCELVGSSNTLHLMSTFSGTEDADSLANIVFASGDGQDFVVFEAQELEYEFKITKIMRLSKTEEPFRRKVCETKATLEETGEAYDIEITDVGFSGIGALVPYPIEVGEDVVLALNLIVGQVKLEASVKRCYKPRYDDDRYHVGLKVEPKTRVDQARWTQFISLTAS